MYQDSDPVIHPLVGEMMAELISSSSAELRVPGELHTSHHQVGAYQGFIFHPPPPPLDFKPDCNM